MNRLEHWRPGHARARRIRQTQSTVEDLGRRIDAVESILAIQNLKARYADLVDQRFRKGAVVDEETLAGLADRIAALFTEDAIWDGGPALGVASGRLAIAAQMRSPTLIYSRHLFVKPEIAVSGDDASARWDLLCPCTRPDGSAWWMVGFEDDTYARVDGVWLHASMKLTAVTMSPAGTGWDRIFS